MHTLGKRSGPRATETAWWTSRLGLPLAADLLPGATLPLRAGTRLRLSCSWDNPTTASVGWGENTTDEMCLAYFYLVF
jgi:hypothetical protein